MDDDVRTILTTTRTWAVVGCSADPSRDSHRIAGLLQRSGYRVVPVNPELDEVLGERCYPSLSEIPAEKGVEVVDLFRRSEAVASHVDEAIAIGAGRGVDTARCGRRDCGRAGARGRSPRGHEPLSGDRAAAARGLRQATKPLSPGSTPRR